VELEEESEAESEKANEGTTRRVTRADHLTEVDAQQHADEPRGEGPDERGEIQALWVAQLPAAVSEVFVSRASSRRHMLGLVRLLGCAAPGPPKITPAGESGG
jgi:hypothetical protein